MHSSAYLIVLLFLDFLISPIDSQLISIQYYNKINVALQNVLIFGQENIYQISIGFPNSTKHHISFKLILHSF